MVSANKNKVASVARDMAKYGVEVRHINRSLTEIQSHDFGEVASEKARAAFELTGKPCIVQDSGFFVTALNGFPGVLTHPVLDTIGIEGILRLVEGKRRNCGFVHCIAYYDGKIKAPKLFESRTFGSISAKPRGTSKPHHWSRLFEIYIPKEKKKTLAQMSIEEHMRWHDSTGLDEDSRAFAEWYIKR